MFNTPIFIGKKRVFYEFFMENMKMKRKRDKKFDLTRWGFEPRIFEQVPAHNFNFEGD